MRELKFRFWNECYNKYTYMTMEELIEGYGTDCVDEYLSYENIEQFTGLNDKNGSEIYEGDILKGSQRELNPCGKCGHSEIKIEICKVVWSNYDYNSDYPNNRGAWYCNANRDEYELTDSFGYEVIGNVHETPELLNNPLASKTNP